MTFGPCFVVGLLGSTGSGSPDGWHKGPQLLLGQVKYNSVAEWPFNVHRTNRRILLVSLQGAEPESQAVHLALQAAVATTGY